jgi:hypothetical protein
MGDISFRLDVVESDSTWVVVCTSPYGRTLQKVPAPFSDAELDARLTAVEKSLVRSSAKLVTRRAAAPERTARDFGDELSKTLLAGNIRILFAKCREKAREQGAGLRVLVNPDGPRVSRIPWEFVVDPDRLDDYLALRVPIARSPHLMEPVAPLRFQPPLRVLGVLARPVDLPALDAERERDDLTRALSRLSSDMVQVKWLPGDRWSDLAEEIRSRPWHVLHFVGHGGFDEDSQSGFLELSDDDGNARPILANDLGRLVADNPDLRLVVLNACESAVTGSEGFFSSTAAKLMREGVPAVVAMQYEITDDAALAFSSSFYECLARGMPVDRAVMLARESVKMTMRSLEWATPVLFLASEETHLFAAAEAPARGDTPGARVETDADRGPSSGFDWLSVTRTKLGQILKVGEAPDVPRTIATGGSSPHDRIRAGSSEATRPSPFLPAYGPEISAAGGRPPASETTARGGSVVPAAIRLRVLSGSGPCTHVAVGPRDMVAAVGADGVVRVLSSRSGRCLAQCALTHGERAFRVSWSPWPRHVASSHDGGLVAIWDLETEVPVRVLRAAGRRVEAVAFSHDGRWLAAAGERRLRVFDSNGAQVRDLPVPGDLTVPSEGRPLRTITTIAFSSDDRHVLIAGDDCLVRRLDTNGRVTTVWRHPAVVVSMDVATDWLVTGSVAGRVTVWDWAGRLLHRWEHGSRVEHVAIAADEGSIVSAAGDRTVRTWSSDGRPVSGCATSRPPAGLRFLADGSGLLTVDTGGQLEVWQTMVEEGTA